ncbi:MAG: preprotein translocase subunit SecY [Alphaproteobacteria bacterium]
MSSAAEQLMSNLNWSSFLKAEDLKKRIWFTLGVLIVYRLGTYIPIPGINPAVMGEFLSQNAGGLLGMLDMFSGGSLGRMAIMALNLMPYISASIIVQLMTAVSPHFEALKKEGESGKRKLSQYTRYGTVILASFQAYAIAVGFEKMTGPSGASAVMDPGLFFRLSTVITLVGSTLFLMWLGEQITARGIGNGTSMIIYAGIVANLPQSALQTLELSRTGAIHVLVILLVLVLIAVVMAFIVFMERAHRKVIVQYPKKQVGQRMFAGESTHLPIKLNSTGVIPPIFASSLLLLPTTIAGFSSMGSDSEWLSTVVRMLSHGSPVFMALYAALIIFFAFFYTSIVFNPTETAENLRKNGGFVPGYRPGKMTADFFDYLLTRLTVVGALYLAFICILPEIVMSQVSLSFYFGGTSLLIIVGVTIDTVVQLHSHLIAHHYEKLMKKSYTRGRR